MKRPWNVINSPVYSLATYHDEKVNMNVCTYVSVVSMSPKRYMVAVYHHSKTLENISNSDVAVLQLLSKKQLSLINVLGKRSGHAVDKHQYLTKKKLLTEWCGKHVLLHCAALIEVKKLWSKDAGDHTLFLLDVKKFTTHHNNILMLDDLREQKLIRI